MLPQHERNVHFADHDCVMEIPHINDMSDEQVNDCYMSFEELQAIKDECRLYVRMMDAGLHLCKGKEQFCTRGLDQHTSANKLEAQTIRDDIYDSIFAIQDFQESSGRDFGELIARASQRLSIVSTEKARIAAKADARAVKVPKKKSPRRTNDMMSPIKTVVAFHRKHISVADVCDPRLSSYIPSQSNTNVKDVIDQALNLAYF